MGILDRTMRTILGSPLGGPSGGGGGGGITWATPVDANIVPDAHNSWRVGDYLTRFSEGYFTYQATNNIDWTDAAVGSTTFAYMYSDVGAYSADFVIEGALAIGTGVHTLGMALLTYKPIELRTFNNGAGNSSDIRLIVGTASGTQGDIRLHKAGTTVTVGHVWTATSADGKGYWAAPSGGGITWSTPVDSNITFDTHATYSIGTSSVKANELYTKYADFKLSGTMTNGWGNDVPSLIFDGSTAEAQAQWAVGIILDGDQDTTGGLILQSKDLVSGTASTGEIYMWSGSCLGTNTTGTSGGFYIATGGNGSANTGTTGVITIDTGPTALGSSGFFRAKTGSTSGGVGKVSGAIVLETGNALSPGGNSGAIQITSGQSNTGATGNVLISSGDSSASGITGNVTLSVGSTGGTQGDFRFHKVGTTVTVGHVWTATSADGKGYWAAPGAPTGTANRFAVFNGSGNLSSLNDAVFDGTNGRFAIGQVAAGTRTFTGTGSFFLGRHTSGTINLTANGVFVMGNFNGGGTCVASADGAKIIGNAETGGILSAGGYGSTTIGLSFSGTISASQLGAIAMGYTTSSGTITASGTSAFIHGYSDSSASITSTAAGSFARGRSTGTGSLLSASGTGAFASGSTSTGGDLVASGEGAHAMGAASNNTILQATSVGSVVCGAIATTGTSFIVGVSGRGAFAAGDFAITTGSKVAAIAGVGAIFLGRITDFNTFLHTGNGSAFVGLITSTSAATSISGEGAIVLGRYAGAATASGAGSILAGYFFGTNAKTASAEGAMILGAHYGAVSVSAIGGMVFGSTNTNGTMNATVNAGATASGYANNGPITASGTAAWARGIVNVGSQAITASGIGAVAWGVPNAGSVSIVSSGLAAWSFGDDINTSADYATTFGVGHVNNTYLTTVIGRYSVTPTANLTTWTGADPLFVVGNGASTASRSNAFTIWKDGTVYAQTFNPKASNNYDLGSTTNIWNSAYINFISDSLGNTVFDVGGRIFTDTSATITIDADQRQLYDSGAVVRISWAGGGTLNDSTGNQLLVFDNRLLYSATGTATLDFDNLVLADSTGNISVNWGNRTLTDPANVSRLSWDADRVSIPNTSIRLLNTNGAPPASPLKGDMYFDTGVNKILVYTGTVWETVTSV